ncbi:MAG: RsmE family RNA methyltransferase [Fimbriimonadaceae bacterium]
MDRSSFPPLRSLPRVFLPGLDAQQESYELPKEEVDKFRKVLRLDEGDQIAVLPNDGTLIRCEFRTKQAWPLATEHIETEPKHRVILAQALPKADRIEIVLRMGTELGAVGFILFPAERSVVRWDEAKVQEKARRFNSIIREAAEQSFRCILPTLRFEKSLKNLMASYPNALVLSESERATKALARTADETVLVVGPEGGWAPRETALIGDNGVTLGPLVLRTDTAGPAAIAALLLNSSPQK